MQPDKVNSEPFSAVAPPAAGGEPPSPTSVVKYDPLTQNGGSNFSAVTTQGESLARCLNGLR
jgi:hypothetical protein